MTDKVAVITGANTGIGKETAVALAAMGMTTVLACRNPDKAAAAAAEVRERAASDAVSVVALDLSDLASVTSCAHQILERWDRLDVLVNNAGGIWSTRQESAQGFEQTFAVNHLGPFALTLHLLDRLKDSAPSRIVNLSSFGHHAAVLGMRWEDLNAERRYSSFGAYAQSKLANILFTRALAARLEGTGVTANAVHPGPVRSGFGMDGDLHGIMRFGNELIRPLEISPEAGAVTTIHVATAPELEHSSGGYYARGEPGHMSGHARSLPDADRLWRVSEQLIDQAGFPLPEAERT
ncbi:MAG TPA: SDR family oxidoreductase [Acidimicrobiales bacterium]|jgi:NAD(P)-dependent dehydrogenase (short-subunit alcohol dehydrogenase family)|nr:SDR family oxidoreductase [Acidimicrobiales bacterium]